MRLPSADSVARFLQLARPPAPHRATPPPSVPGLNRELDGIKATIEGVLKDPPTILGGPFTVEDPSDAIASWAFRAVNLQPGETLDVSVQITQSAQQGGLYLSFGGQVDLATGSAFTMTLVGPSGGRRLTFSSGTSLASVAVAINTFSDQTGVVASTSGTGVSLRSADHGQNEFVSVRFGADAAIEGESVGVYGFDPRNSDRVDDRQVSSFSSTAVIDRGQDIAGRINGVPAWGTGATLHASGTPFAGSLTLASPALGVPGDYFALRLVGAAGQPDPDPTLDLKG